MLGIGAAVLNTNPAQSGAFWRQALGYGAGSKPDFLQSPLVDAPDVHFDATDGTHLDLWTDSAAEQQAEVERLIALGAHRVGRESREDSDFIVLRDPAGTLF